MICRVNCGGVVHRSIAKKVSIVFVLPLLFLHLLDHLELVVVLGPLLLELLPPPSRSLFFLVLHLVFLP